MKNKVLLYASVIIGSLAVILTAGLLIFSGNDADLDEDNSAVFESVSALDVLYLKDPKTDDQKENEDTGNKDSALDEASSSASVSEPVEHVKVDVSEKIVTEAQIDADLEDTKVQDEDENTILNEVYADELADFDEGISDEAEDLLAQIETENNAQENKKHNDNKKPAAEIPAEYASAHSGKKGIDVSKHNGNIDWGAVKNSGVEFAIIRCGYRGSSSGVLVIDPMYETNIKGAIAAGIPVGVYFFSQAVNEAEAVEEASMVLQLISGYSLQYPVYIDAEKSRGRGDGISVDERTNVCRAFLETVSGAGYSAGLYSNKLWLEGMIHTSQLTNYKIWLAQYEDIPSYTSTRYDIWQYTSKGSVAGVSGNVDMNVLK